MAKKYLDEAGVAHLINKFLTLLSEKIDKNKIGSGLNISQEGLLSIANEVFQQINQSESNASQSAITAGNYAAQAIQAKNAIDQKIWYGTIEEYNSLETVSNSTIYIILHE